MRPVCWNIITQIVKKYARDTLIPTKDSTPDEGPRRTETSHLLIKSLELMCHAVIFDYVYIYI